ncbi:unnamed protein product [Mytilus coruscus]|uniref:Uncharacterized protein n=1 Tax=Mytilus coruscus TaxID=42192 RepID=A0A6J8DC78_MYTCO|nr:unnamed protein product [Mytilus coruscus]
MNLIESQKTASGEPSPNSTNKTSAYEDVDLDHTDVKVKSTSNKETPAEVKQHNEDYLKKQKEDEEKEKDNPTTPPAAVVYSFVNKPKNTTENKTSSDQQEEDVYEESKEGLYDTSGNSPHKEPNTTEQYDTTENIKKEESENGDLSSAQKGQIVSFVYKLIENDSELKKEEKRQVATVSPTVRSSFESQGEGQTNTSNDVQSKQNYQNVKPEDQTGLTGLAPVSSTVRSSFESQGRDTQIGVMIYNPSKTIKM